MNSIHHQKIIDTHIHLWDLQKYSYDWIKSASAEKLKENYVLENFLQDSNSLNVEKAIHVQAEINTNLNIQETKWLQSIADNNTKGIPNAIIGFVDLAQDNVEEELEQHMQFCNFRGIRQILKYENKEENNEPNLLKNEKWNHNLKFLEKKNLSFDLLIFYHQYKQAASVIDNYPQLHFVINHTLWPQDVSDENFALWQNAINILASFENVSIKLSGFGERDSNWKLENIKGFVNYTIEKFGIERCMFASNFPVDRANSTKLYSDYWNAYFSITSHFNQDEKNCLFYKNAEQIYKI